MTDAGMGASRKVLRRVGVAMSMVEHAERSAGVELVCGLKTVAVLYYFFSSCTCVPCLWW